MSWIEVEMKFHVRNPNEMRKKIKGISKYVGIENKKDSYYSLSSKAYPKKSLRVRNKGKKVEVNFKQSLGYFKGVHAKNEVEFRVSDLQGFFDLLEEFGFKMWVQKDKKTELYRTNNGVNIELNYVRRLGWFVEIEILCPRKDVVKARQKILKVRDSLGVKQKDIEKRGYTKQLWDLKKK